MSDTLKLFKVKVIGFTEQRNNTFMVVARDPTSAYDSVKDFLDKKDYGFEDDRQLDSVELVADSYENGKHLVLIVEES